MKIYRSKRVVHISLFFSFLFAGLGAPSKAADPCDISLLPQELQTKLTKEYPDWQPERLENLGELDRAYRTKAHPKDCPGIAIGHFESKPQLSFALFLVPRLVRKQQGFQLVVFSRTEPSALFVSHTVFQVDTGNFYERSDLVISRVPPGQYEEVEEDSGNPRKVSLHLDGLLYEAIGKASSLYYWENGKYKGLPLSD
jgi:hypothetical protein